MTWIRTATGTSAVTILTLLLVVALAAPAAAANDTQRRREAPGHATFEGRTIDLTRGWGDAHACVVWTRTGETDCFRTERAADAAVERRDRAEARTASAAMARTASARSIGAGGPSRGLGDADAWAQVTSTCVDWLTLYEHSGFGGRSLRFRDRSVYQDLADWGFANQTSSYQVGGCATTLRDSGWVGYPGATGRYASGWSMASGWDDRVRYLRIS